jgi:sugar/nucleoside kinase (ribokinase family)
MSARSGIIAGGNWIIDRLKIVDVYPEQDALANIISESVGNGGSPFNVLVDLARLGASFPLAGIGLIGDDANGKWITEQCKENRFHFLHRCHDGAGNRTPDFFPSARGERFSR